MAVSPSCPFFSQAQWYAAWMAAFGVGREVEWLTLTDQVSVPLVVRRDKRAGLPLTVLQAPANEHSPCFRLPCLPELTGGDLASAVEALARRRSFAWLEFPLMVQGTRETGALAALAEAGWPVLVEDHPHTALADLSEGWEAYHQGLSKKLRANTNRAENGLRRLGDLEFTEAARGGDWRAMWAAFLDLEAAGWKGEVQGAIGHSRQLCDFYQRVLAEAHRQDRLRLYALHLNDRLIGANLVILDGGLAYGWKTTYAPDLAKYSPGNVLQRYVTRALAEEGVAILDMLDPVTEWKRRWASRIEPRCHVRLFSPDWRGRALYRLVSKKAKAMEAEK